ncbi:MAG TPA: hypothetical protein VK105_08580 [Virgibacillus sp.]|nr:hypothetical protein [Virgibacillus sp.]HLR67174.1 hypothetical protein [Virgibacillus sp.]
MKNKLNNGRENKFYIGIIITLCLLLGVFFTSKYWMYDDSVIAQTDYDKSINGLNQTTLTLRDWEYNPTNHLMEVTIEREHTGTDAVEPTFTFEAKGKETKDMYPAKKVYESDEIMVIHIENVPSKYHVIGLFVTEHRDNKILKQEYKKKLKDDKDKMITDEDKIEQSRLPKPEEIIIIGDYRKIKDNKDLAIKSEKEYKKENIIEEINRIEQETSLITDESIPFEEDLIATLTKEKSAIKEDMKYETKEEKNQSESEIEQKENAIVSAEEEIEQYKNHVKDLKEKYGNREEKLEALLHPEREIEKEQQEEKEKKEEREEKKKEQKEKSKKAKEKEKSDKDKSK